MYLAFYIQVNWGTEQLQILPDIFDIDCQSQGSGYSDHLWYLPASFPHFLPAWDRVSSNSQPCWLSFSSPGSQGCATITTDVDPGSGALTKAFQAHVSEDKDKDPPVHHYLSSNLSWRSASLARSSAKMGVLLRKTSTPWLPPRASTSSLSRRFLGEF